MSEHSDIADSYNAISSSKLENGSLNPSPPSSFWQDTATIIDEWFQKLTLSYGNVDITTVAGTLVFPNPGSGASMASDIGLAIQTYWSLAITPGIPEGGEGTCPAAPHSIISLVTNTASTLSAPITAGLLSLSLEFGDDKNGSQPNFKEFTDIIFDEVLKLEWTVVEIGGLVPAVPSPLPCPPYTYTVTISR